MCTVVSSKIPFDRATQQNHRISLGCCRQKIKHVEDKVCAFYIADAAFEHYKLRYQISLKKKLESEELTLWEAI